jgi:hypothetical protein
MKYGFETATGAMIKIASGIQKFLEGCTAG